MIGIPTWKEMQGLKNDEPFRDFIGVEQDMQSEIDALRALLASQTSDDTQAHKSTAPVVARLLTMKFKFAHQRRFGTDNLTNLRNTCLDAEELIEQILHELNGQADYLDEKEPHKITQSWAFVHWLQQHSKDVLTIFSKDDLDRIRHGSHDLLVKMVSDPSGTKTSS